MAPEPRPPTDRDGPRHAAPRSGMLWPRVVIATAAVAVLLGALAVTGPRVVGALAAQTRPTATEATRSASPSSTTPTMSRPVPTSTPSATPSPRRTTSTPPRTPTPTSTRTKTPKPRETAPPKPRPTKTTPRPTRTTAPPAPQESGVVGEVVRLVNAERAKAGGGAMRVDQRLLAAAQKHSEDQAATGTMSHTSSDGRGMADRIKAEGYPYRSAGENVAAGQPDAASVMGAWMDSPGHRGNILNCGFTDIGVGVARGGGDYGIYWTQVFGSR
ncbi:MAG: CAP domain-containing protein [Phycicoccus sp.]